MTMNLLTRNIILLALDAFGGSIDGKTLLQKRLYFLSQLLRRNSDLQPGFAYDAHFYGPYSSVVAADVTTLVNQGFIREDTSYFGAFDNSGFEVRKCRYELTPVGKSGVEWLKDQYPNEAKKVKAAAEMVLAAGSLNYVDLSIAAKAHLILERANRPLNSKNVADEAKKFSWVVEEQKIDNGLTFLKKLGLTSKH
jgi:uncharacterized protein YwgA